MPRFLCRTRAGEDADKKVRVYFTCHEEDFDKYFEDICGQILKVFDCAVYYTDDMSVWYSPDELFSKLEMMDIIVIPISFVWFASQNRSHETEFFHAWKNHIPFLPVMVEEESGEYWARAYSDSKEKLSFVGDNYEDALKAGFARFEGEERDLLTDIAARVDKMCRAGWYDKALCLQERLHRLTLERYGRLHAETLNALHGIAFIENMRGEYEHALCDYREIFDGRIELFGENSIEALDALHNIAFTLGKLGRYGEACEKFLYVYDHKKELYGGDNDDTLATLEDLAVEYKLAGKFLERAQALEKAYAIRCRLHGKDADRTVDAMYEVVGRYSLAEAWDAEIAFSEKAYEYFSELTHELDFCLIRIVKSIAEAYVNLCQYRKAAEWYERLYDIYRANYGDDDHRAKQIHEKYLECAERITVGGNDTI